MKTQMRRRLAREPFEKKIHKVEQLVRLAREFPRKDKPSRDKMVGETLKNPPSLNENQKK
jgi:hypothetical protein